LPDSGRGYLEKIFNDDWMTSHGYADVVKSTRVEPIAGKYLDEMEKTRQ